ncbi:NAD(P)/FAD-dependent oxidoreductase [Nocardioides marmoriginsengisoli]|uniref:NAD(P)/FAD-dependent oxidoreductase n=1 Tax=Nocardioides marmoriginsengisoli TaxID=661483 RepID=UPI00161EC37C|nr:FAD-dependent oxidoreductase [Nocardioides marmoriginsengisoli]
MAEARTTDVAIVGGGIVGLSIALSLAEAGVAVTVLDKGVPGKAASSRNGGGVRQQGRAFPELALAQQAIEAWPTWAERLGGPTGYRRTGHLVVAADAGELAALEERSAAEAEHGLKTTIVDGADVAAMAPGLAPGHVGGKLCETDGMALPAVVMQTMHAAAVRAGVEVRPYAEVTRLRVDRGTVTGVELADGTSLSAGTVVNAAGPWSSVVAASAGVYLPVAPSRLHMFRTVPLDRTFAHVWVARASMDLNACQWEDGSILFGGATRPDPTQWTFSHEPGPAFVEDARAKAAEVAPMIAAATLARRWTGVREFTPDMLPVIGRPREVGGLFTCTGFSGHGFALGPVIGDLVAGWIRTGERPPVLEPFAPDRFAVTGSPFNHPPAPWGGATTEVVPSRSPHAAPAGVDDGPFKQHSGVPSGFDLPTPLED